MKTLNVGLVGYGFMGRAHCTAYTRASEAFELPCRFNLRTVAGRDRRRVQAFAANWGFEKSCCDWKEVISDPGIDIVDIASPNDTHLPIATEAAKAGKIVFCEKPLGRTLSEAQEMTTAIEEAGVANMIWYNYRRVPAVTMIKELVSSGRIGRIYHYRSQFLQDWGAKNRLDMGGDGLWRFDKAVAGSGVVGDLLAHCIDLAIWLVGDITEVSAVSQTFVKERRQKGSGEKRPVELDDATSCIGKFGNEAVLSLEASRYARGHGTHFTVEINGDKGSVAWDLEDLHRLRWFDNADQESEQGWRSIHVTGATHPYMRNWWIQGLQIGYEHSFIHQVADFATHSLKDEGIRPSFRDGLATEYVIDAILRSALSGRKEEVGDSILAAASTDAR